MNKESVYADVGVYRPLSEKEKLGLSNEQIFMRERGLYSSFIYSEKWCNLFREIYGCDPELPGSRQHHEQCK